MGFLAKGQYENRHVFGSITFIAVIGFLVSLSTAYVKTIWSVYIYSFVNSAAIVGLLTAFLTIVSLLSTFLFVPVVEKSNKARLFLMSLILFGISYILFAINSNFYIFVIIAFFSTIFGVLRLLSFGIIVRDKSKKSQISQSEGLVYTFSNIAWVLGPLIAGFISENFGIRNVFVLASVFMFVSFFLFKFFNIQDSTISRTIHKNSAKNIADYFKNFERTIIYFVGGGVTLWWAFIYTFIPIYIIQNNLAGIWVAYFLFAIPIPLILLEYKFSTAIRKTGFRKMFMVGFLFVSLMSFICFFISNVYFVLLILVLASIGMAMLEPTTEAYFFAVCNKEEEQRFYGIFSTRFDANYFLATISSAVLLTFLPFKFMFILFGIFMLAMFLISMKIKK
ncbi:MFS transporter [Candidatus Pacearchaeota archaeon]|nr:MFS transporter [Candidatus Pacearchaeota archaeon]